MRLILPRTNEMGLAAVAEAWADTGWRVVPMSLAKKPLIKWRGVLDRDPIDALHAFLKVFGSRSNVMLSIALPGDVMVLDLDHRPEKGWDARATYRDLNNRYNLPRAPVCRTPSGGCHIWLSVPDGLVVRNATSSLSDLGFEGVDIRAVGGLALVPPSRRPAGVYQWSRFRSMLPTAPADLIRSLEAKSFKAVPASAKPFESERIGPYGDAALRGELTRLARCPKGGRNIQLFTSAARLGSLHAAGILPDVRAQLETVSAANGLVADDGSRAVKATIESGWRRGVSMPRDTRSVRHGV